jgi:hypothetical protein
MYAAHPQAVLSASIETAVFVMLTVDAGAEDRFRDLHDPSQVPGQGPGDNA